jgi:hypothetical protein
LSLFLLGFSMELAFRAVLVTIPFCSGIAAPRFFAAAERALRSFGIGFHPQDSGIETGCQFPMSGCDRRERLGRAMGYTKPH